MIAAIRFSSMGDIICTSPAVRALKRRYPDQDIVYITTEPYKQIAAAIPGVDRVEALPKRGADFRLAAEKLAANGPWSRVADLQGSPRSGKLSKMLQPADAVVDTPPRLRRTALIATRLRIGSFPPVPERMLKRVESWGVDDDGGSLELHLPDDVRTMVSTRWGSQLNGAVVLVPGARHKTKQWPPEYWIELIQRLVRHRPVVILGADGDFSFMPEAPDGVLDLTGQTAMLESAAVLELADAAITGDTGPMHLAVAMQTPLVALFGPTVREFGFYPFRHKRSVVLERKLMCRPCSSHGSSRCPLGHHRCLRDIRVDEVMAALADIEQ